MSTFLAVDFGAGSGRVIAGRVSGGQLELDELHRFPNRQVRLGGHVYWDFPASVSYTHLTLPTILRV